MSVNPKDIPIYPNKEAATISGNRIKRIAELISLEGMRKDDMAVNATTMIIV